MKTAMGTMHAALLLGVLAAAGSPATAQDAGAAKLPPAGEAWEMSALNEEPVKIVRHSYDPKARKVTFLLEFTRDLDIIELVGWTGRLAPFHFRFLDDDGVVLTKASLEIDGRVQGERGSRIRIIMTLPDEDTLGKSTKIIAKHRLF